MKNIITLTLLTVCLISGISLAVHQKNTYNHAPFEALGGPTIASSAFALNASDPPELIEEKRKNLGSMDVKTSLPEPLIKQVGISEGQLLSVESKPGSTQNIYPKRE